MRILHAVVACCLVGSVFGASLDSQGFVRDWLVSGPYPNYLNDDGSTRGLETDFLFDAGGEQYAFPKAGDRRRAEFVADKSKLIAGQGSVNEWGRTETFSADATWRARTFGAGVIETDELFPGVADHFVLYALSYFSVPEETEARIAVGSDDYHALFVNDRPVGSRRTSQGVAPGDFNYTVKLRKGRNKLLFKLVEIGGGSGFCVQLLDKGGRPLSGVTVDNMLSGTDLAAFEKALHPPRPLEVVRGENAELAAKIKKLRQETIPALERRVSEGRGRKQAAKAALMRAFGKAERTFAETRAANLKGAPKSVDLPLGGQEARRKLCLNGEWDGSVDGGTSWQKVRLPSLVSGHYFQPWHNPVRRSDPDNPWSKLVPVEGWEDWKLHPSLSADSCQNGPILYRTVVDWDGKGAVDFVSEGVQGSVEVVCNGVPCGSYDGNIGIVRVPLEGLRKGANELVLKFGLMKIGQHSRDGLLGDLYVEYLPETRVEGVEIKTGWESATLSVKTELANRTAGQATLTVRTRVVEGNRVRLVLPEVEVALAAGESRTVETASKWADPKPWGIGGQYGNPDLYVLVTDVLEGGKLVDRHRETFGYREFRIFHTDFFLNGRRIVLQGDTGHTAFELKRVRDIAWNIYREDGINIIRTHDGAYWSVPAVADADKVGMLMYMQMYPVLNPFGEADDKVRKSKKFVSHKDWLARKEHRWNLANYRRWWRTFRNHPSVVIWSTDNEVLTQAWDTAADADYNVRSEKIAAEYEKYVKGLDPACVMTRNGDLSTQNRKQRWFEDPPCDTANYHYPDFNVDSQVRNWRKTYEWRPVVFGETLYCSYGQWDGWPGPLPAQVQKKADKVRRIVGVYRDEEIPAAIYMGIGVDGYAVEDDSGKGNPFGITKSEKDAYKKNGTRPKGMGPRDYPWGEIAWPSLSGRGLRNPAVRRDWWYYTCELINAFDPRFPAVTRNAVANAYRETLLPQPALRNGCDAEVLVAGAASHEDVWATCPDGSLLGVRADGNGKAWFVEIMPGRYAFRAGGETVSAVLKPRGASALEPGFGGLETVSFLKRHAPPVRETPALVAPAKAQLVPNALAARELDVGACLFRDRSFTLKECPAALKGAVYLAGPFADAPSVRAVVAASGIVTVISPKSGPVSQAALLKEQGFSVDESIPEFQAWGRLGCDKASVWRKYARKGEGISFGKWAVICDFDADNLRVERPTDKNRALMERLRRELTAEEVLDVNATSPDYAVWIPPHPSKRAARVKAATHDTYNDHFQVIYDERRNCHYAFWTQATREPMCDHHTAFRKSVDGGRTWSPIVHLAGTTNTNPALAGTCVSASWQQPMLAKGGRLYVLWSRGHDHKMAGRYSDDGGETWTAEELVDFDTRTPREVKEGALRAAWWCNWQRPLRLGPDGHFLVGSSRGKDGLEFWEFLNIDENPEVRDIRIAVHSNGDKALKVPPDENGRSVCEEASIVKLPDGRLFAVMRATGGAAVWSVSSDQGRTWMQPEQLRTKDGGELIRHSVSPCPVYDWKGCEAGSGVYFGLFHLEVTDHRGPLYLVPGTFNPAARQPVEFTGSPKLFEPRSHWNSFYTSYTDIDGKGTLWYPDAAKFYLLGRDITPDFFDKPKE